jgi:hypothetical protein
MLTEIVIADVGVAWNQSKQITAGFKILSTHIQT